MDEERIEKEAYAWVLTPLHWFSAYTLPSSAKWLTQSTRAITKKWVKKAWEEMVKELAKKRAFRTIGKLWAKMWAKHLAWLAPAATWVWAVAVPLLQAWLLASDIYDLYNLSKDEEFKEWIKYLSQDALDWAKNIAKQTLEWIWDLWKNAKKQLASAFKSAKSKAKKALIDASPKAVAADKINIFPVATMPDGRTRYSDWSIK